MRRRSTLATTNANRSLALLNTAKSTDRERIRARIAYRRTLTTAHRLAFASVPESSRIQCQKIRHSAATKPLHHDLRPPLPELQASVFPLDHARQVENPLVGTNLIWADDLSFDGASGALRSAILRQHDTAVLDLPRLASAGNRPRCPQQVYVRLAGVVLTKTSGQILTENLRWDITVTSELKA